MPRIRIDGNTVLSLDTSPRKKYWTKLSQQLISKYGREKKTDHKTVESLLIDCFQSFIKEFQALCLEEGAFKFYLYVFWLHEESIKLHIKTLGGLKLGLISDDEFSMYRRILKLVIEQGCEIDLAWGHMPTQEEMDRIDQKMQDLIYLGTWLYGFADFIAFQKMVEDCHYIEFDEAGLLVIDWQFHYGAAYKTLFPPLRKSYSESTFDEHSMVELRSSIERCFGISYDFAGAQIFEIKKQHKPQNPDLETIQPYILPLNLIASSGITEEVANRFYNGLTLSRHNKLSIEKAILKPYSMSRYLFRPILIYNIGGEKRALVGKEKFVESMVVLATNAMHWNAMQGEWLQNKCMQDFVNKKRTEHDRILEDQIEKIITDDKYLFCRNIKSFKQKTGSNFRIDNELAGQIDFIIVDTIKKIIFVCETKYNRARYEAVGYRNDYSNFTKDHERQLERKLNWVKENIPIVQDHLSIVYSLPVLDLAEFSAQAIFLINTPTFYMLNGNFYAITLSQLQDFLRGKLPFPTLLIEEKGTLIEHPYFRKPLQPEA